MVRYLVEVVFGRLGTWCGYCAKTRCIRCIGPPGLQPESAFNIHFACPISSYLGNTRVPVFVPPTHEAAPDLGLGSSIVQFAGFRHIDKMELLLRMSLIFSRQGAFYHRWFTHSDGSSAFRWGMYSFHHANPTVGLGKRCIAESTRQRNIGRGH